MHQCVNSPFKGSNSLAIVVTNIELDSHEDSCVVDDNFFVVHDQKRPVNVFRYNPKVGLKHACIINATVAYTKHETCHVVILLINRAIEMKGLYHHFLYQMQCCMNGVVID